MQTLCFNIVFLPVLLHQQMGHHSNSIMYYLT